MNIVVDNEKLAVDRSDVMTTRFTEIGKMLHLIFVAAAMPAISAALIYLAWIVLVAG